MFPRTANGDVPPIRSIQGSSTGLRSASYLDGFVPAGPPPPPTTLVAAVLPSSRSVRVGGAPATAFVTIINAGGALALEQGANRRLR